MKNEEEEEPELFIPIQIDYDDNDYIVRPDNFELRSKHPELIESSLETKEPTKKETIKTPTKENAKESKPQHKIIMKKDQKQKQKITSKPHNIVSKSKKSNKCKIIKANVKSPKQLRNEEDMRILEEFIDENLEECHDKLMKDDPTIKIQINKMLEMLDIETVMPLNNGTAKLWVCMAQAVYKYCNEGYVDVGFTSRSKKLEGTKDTPKTLFPNTKQRNEFEAEQLKKIIRQSILDGFRTLSKDDDELLKEQVSKDDFGITISEAEKLDFTHFNIKNITLEDINTEKDREKSESEELITNKVEVKINMTVEKEFNPTAEELECISFYSKFLQKNFAISMIQHIKESSQNGLFKTYDPSRFPLVFTSIQKGILDYLPTLDLILPLQALVKVNLLPPNSINFFQKDKNNFKIGKVIAYGLFWGFYNNFNLFGIFYHDDLKGKSKEKSKEKSYEGTNRSNGKKSTVSKKKDNSYEGVEIKCIWTIFNRLQEEWWL